VSVGDNDVWVVAVVKPPVAELQVEGEVDNLAVAVVCLLGVK